jgi:hypothetical protein
MQNKARVIDRSAQGKKLNAHPGKRAAIGATVMEGKCRIGHSEYAKRYRQTGHKGFKYVVSDTVPVSQSFSFVSDAY